MNLLAFADPAVAEPVNAAVEGTTNMAKQAAQTVTDTVGTSWEAVRLSFQDAWEQTISVAPQIVAMVVVIVIGYFVAHFVGKAMAALAEKLGLQNAADQSGLADSMRRMGIQRNLPTIVGVIVFWLLLCVFLMAGFNILGAEPISNAMATVVNYIPKLLVATIVIVVGLLLASFLRGVVATSADRVGLS